MGSISWMVRVFCFFPATSWKVMTLPLLGGRAGCRHLTPLAISRLHGSSHTSLQQPHPPPLHGYHTALLSLLGNFLGCVLTWGWGGCPARAGGVLRLSLRSSLHTSGGMQDMRAVLGPSSSNISTVPPSSLTYNSLIPPSHPHFLHHLLYP
ncbi:unnamed protein product [Tuber melanosporum]|uniref:(Perigord truffle) hypothetical protein n=1 Tax=Tuber melanosporum (strain Mel28) TaxID=656061 RepID=D5GAN5_TUBMM|nr:uncharacterized protein GSTUM_00003652001 [Tuber melanosporum]CAZ81578.1 unnamed protein product [Tuber melanosporum]